MKEIYSLIGKLGISRTYKGHPQLAMVLKIAMETTENPLLVTKLLYPEVASAFNTAPSNIERNLRTVITICWEHGNRSFLESIAGYRLIIKPTTKEFIEILAAYLTR